MASRVVELSERFRKDYRRLDPNTQCAADDAIRKLYEDPIPGALRHHTLGGHKPKIHVIDVRANHAHQITFHWDGNTIRLLRIGTHRQIDAAPR